MQRARGGRLSGVPRPAVQGQYDSWIRGNAGLLTPGPPPAPPANLTGTVPLPTPVPPPARAAPAPAKKKTKVPSQTPPAPIRPRSHPPTRIVSAPVPPKKATDPASSSPSKPSGVKLDEIERKLDDAVKVIVKAAREEHTATREQLVTVLRKQLTTLQEEQDGRTKVIVQETVQQAGEVQLKAWLEALRPMQAELKHATDTLNLLSQRVLVKPTLPDPTPPQKEMPSSPRKRSTQAAAYHGKASTVDASGYVTRPAPRGRARRRRASEAPEEKEQEEEDEDEQPEVEDEDEQKEQKEQEVQDEDDDDDDAPDDAEEHPAGEEEEEEEEGDEDDDEDDDAPDDAHDGDDQREPMDEETTDDEPPSPRIPKKGGRRVAPKANPNTAAAKKDTSKKKPPDNMPECVATAMDMTPGHRMQLVDDHLESLRDDVAARTTKVSPEVKAELLRTWGARPTTPAHCVWMRRQAFIDVVRKVVGAIAHKGEDVKERDNVEHDDDEGGDDNDDPPDDGDGDEESDDDGEDDDDEDEDDEDDAKGARARRPDTTAMRHRVLSTALLSNTEKLKVQDIGGPWTEQAFVCAKTVVRHNLVCASLEVEAIADLWDLLKWKQAMPHDLKGRMVSLLRVMLRNTSPEGRAIADDAHTHVVMMPQVLLQSADILVRSPSRCRAHPDVLALSCAERRGGVRRVHAAGLPPATQ